MKQTEAGEGWGYQETCVCKGPGAGGNQAGLRALREIDWGLSGLKKFAFNASPKSGLPMFPTLARLPCSSHTAPQGSLTKVCPFWNSTQTCLSL